MTLIRYIGNFLCILGYPVLLYLNPIVGASIKTAGHLLLITYFIKYQQFDMLTSLFFFTILDLIYLLKGIVNKKEESLI